MMLFRILSLLLFIIGLLIMFILKFLSRKNNNWPKVKKGGHNFCFLVPARYESKVIEGLLISIKNQSVKVNMKDVYVIVESLKDETVNICKKYSASVILRKKLNLQRKGYALDEAVKEILLKKQKYDAYFIFDADNVLDKNYIKNMIPIFDKGYDLASGYRNCKNGNKSVVAAASALTFSLVNTVFNNKKNKETRNITFSGTGFYVRGYLIEKWKGYPFHTLTEDYELSSYATLNNLTTYYNTKSIFYDEQPLRFKDTINQRIRWIRGYFDVRKIYNKKMIKSINKNDKNKYRNQKVVGTDLLGNQYVWIPCTTDSSSSDLQYARTEWGVEVDGDDNSRAIKDELTLTDASVTYSDSDTANGINADVSKEIVAQIKAEKASVAQYGGYYIGRYEVGRNSDTAVVKYNQTPYASITWSTAYGLAKKIITNSEVNSYLCSSYAWDTAVNFIQNNSTAKNYATSIEGFNGNWNSQEVKDPSGNVIKPAGTSQQLNTGLTTQFCNIFDMGGNEAEFTTELNPGTSETVVLRGGAYSYYDGPAGYRWDYRSGANDGFRATLFLK